MTPYEGWSDERPTVNHLRVFGCTGFAHVPKDERKKLDSKARKCIFLGYGSETKGYRVYDPERRRVFHTRDVIFHEFSNYSIEEEPSATKEEENHERLVEFDYSLEEPVQDEESKLELRRSTRERKPPNYYGEWVTISNSEMSVKGAMIRSDKIEWQVSMRNEMKSLQENNVCDLVELPKDRKAMGSKWVFKPKTNTDGSVERYKARLVAQDFSQKFGSDYDETFTPVVTFESVRTVISLAAQHGLQLHQMGVTTAFLNRDLQDVVYMKQPEGFEVKGKEELVCKLNRSIYALKQSPRCWNTVQDNKLKKMGFVQTTGDPCVYITSVGEMCIILLHVDDLLLACKSEERMAEIKEELAKQFVMKAHHFLGVKVIQNLHDRVWIGQPAFMKSVREKFGMENSKPVTTPVKAVDDSEKINQAKFQFAVGSLLCLSTRTRPDIAYAMNNVAGFCAEPTNQHWTAVKRNGTQELGMLYNRGEMKDCVGYSDADWAGDLNDRKFTSGYVFQTGGGAVVSWRSKKQSRVALSTAEAEYMALASASQEAVWMRQLLLDLGIKHTAATLVFEDNRSAIGCPRIHSFMHAQNMSTSNITLFVSKSLRGTLN